MPQHSWHFSGYLRFLGARAQKVGDFILARYRENGNGFCLSFGLECWLSHPLDQLTFRSTPWPNQSLSTESSWLAVSSWYPSLHYCTASRPDNQMFLMLCFAVLGGDPQPPRPHWPLAEVSLSDLLSAMMATSDLVPWVVCNAVFTSTEALVG